jgi:hypothetical protein
MLTVGKHTWTARESKQNSIHLSCSDSCVHKALTIASFIYSYYSAIPSATQYSEKVNKVTWLGCRASFSTNATSLISLVRFAINSLPNTRSDLDQWSSMWEGNKGISQGISLKKTTWSESASELYRPSNRRLSAKWLPTFADKGCHVVSVTNPYGRILGFLDRSRYFSIK